MFFSQTKLICIKYIMFPDKSKQFVVEYTFKDFYGILLTQKHVYTYL